MSLIACLPLKDDYNDKVGTNHGTNTGTDLVGWGALFNASTDVITLANESNFDFDVASAVSVSVLFKVNTINITRYLFSKRVLSPANTGFEAHIGTNNKISFARITNSSSYDGIYTTNAVIAVNKVYHVVITSSGGSGVSTMCIYQNGVILPVTTEANNIGASILNNTALQIGANTNEANRNFDGIIGETRIYNHALTATEIKNLYSFYKGFM